MNTRLLHILPVMFAANIALAQQAEQPEAVTLFASPEQPQMLSAPSYRIPAIAQCADGSLVAVGDYRYQLSDIGVGRGNNLSQIELHYRRSTDGGTTWSDEQLVSRRNADDPSDWRWAMGDASIVADSESAEVLLLCPCGSTAMWHSTAEKPIRVARFRSHDNGQTWDDGEEITSHIYGLYGGDATAIFITSGSLCMSRQIKGPLGYHRIYAAHPIRTKSRGNSTSVIYSDDFGETWHILGPADQFPTNTVYEEGKVEEMPDGSVVLMVRDDAGARDVALGKKSFNVFTYTDVAKGEGYWSEAVSGITGMAGACNNALKLVPAIRQSDGKPTHVAIVPLPFHTQYVRDKANNYGRKSVGFYYKEISSPADYASGAALADGWKRGYQVTDRCSAYTDLCLMTDGQIALFMEDNGKQGTGADGNNETEAYDLVFRRLSLALITNGEYSNIIPHHPVPSLPERIPSAHHHPVPSLPERISSAHHHPSSPIIKHPSS